MFYIKTKDGIVKVANELFSYSFNPINVSGLTGLNKESDRYSQNPRANSFPAYDLNFQSEIGIEHILTRLSVQFLLKSYCPNRVKDKYEVAKPAYFIISPENDMPLEMILKDGIIKPTTTGVAYVNHEVSAPIEAVFLQRL
jgi:hypothetical protein